MKRFSTLLLMCGLFMFMATNIWAQTTPVTFQVNMDVKIQEMAFDPATDTVAVRGSFNGWGGIADSLTDGDGDNIYAGTVDVADSLGGVTQFYKFILAQPSGVAWENDPNREFTFTAGTPLTLEPDFFDRDSEVTLPGDSINVGFSVNMSVKEAEGRFDPAEDIVVVRGDFNDWGGNSDQLLDGDADQVYDGTIRFDNSANYLYKFVISGPGGDAWEGDITPPFDNRDLMIQGTPGDTTLPTVFFENDTDIDPPSVTGTVFFQVNTSVFETLGLFTPSTANDTMAIRGSFNNWGPNPPANSVMQPAAGDPGVYELNATVSAVLNSTVNYKHFMQLDTLVHGNVDGWEESPTVGGGNRQITFEGTTNEQFATSYFMDIPPEGALTTGTVTVHLSVDMNPALTLADPFDPATDQVFFSSEDQFMGALQGWDPQRGVQESLVYTDGDGDGVYDLTIELQAPLYFALVYRVAFGDSATATIAEGGGFDFGKSRARYLWDSNTNSIPSEITLETDVYTEDPPLVVEPHPIFTTSIGEDGGNNIPVQFELKQNFPNPFNPETTIEYALDKASAVSLVVYNTLGQAVRTLVNGKVNPGIHSVVWDGKNQFEAQVTSGIYFYRLSVGNNTAVRKMVLMR